MRVAYTTPGCYKQVCVYTGTEVYTLSICNQRPMFTYDHCPNT